ncbi:uncharacterized protein N7479_009238 [Penicillium vulpinum]|uniref:uncharacterized protein n=1 Tax=Penicillium vulpinum TaxID=29845 RepID=UPI0025468399|nr:uncharacterized protein N7479_009238 [Penicillium vulpinum]KAJ5950825.1 hypothetical protein N7479_009238 [Penicillium vulpinum]
MPNQNEDILVPCARNPLPEVNIVSDTSAARSHFLVDTVVENTPADPALGTDDIVEGSPSSSSPEITSPPQPASSNQSHCGILTAPPAALPTPQPCLDTILIDELTSIGGQNDQRETSQQFLPDTSTAAKEYDMFEKTLQASELNPSQPWSAIPGSTAVPSAAVIQNCVRGYFERFHIHYVLFHPHTLNLNQMASPLILVICAIGALYRLDRKLSAFLICMAERALDMLCVKRDGGAATPSFEANATRSSTRQTTTSPKPLWELQTRVLLVFVAAIGGQSAFSRKAIDGIGCKSFQSYTTVHADKLEYRILASYLYRDSWQAYVSWNQWIERESKKRVLHAILMISDILYTAFRVPPVISIAQEYDVDLPDDDELWHAPTELDWMLITQARTRDPLPSVRSAVSQILHGGSPEIGLVSDQLSPCAVAVIMHAISIHTWHLIQSAQTLTGFGLNPHPAEGVQDLLTSRIETALSRCYVMISNARAVNESTWNETEGPILFNSLTMLRGIHIRVLTGVGGLDRMVLLSDDEEDMAAAVKDYVAQNSKWHAASAKTACVTFDGIMTILKSDAFLLRKTAAFNWGVEHALVGIDCERDLTLAPAIFISSCIQKIQLRQKRHEDANPAESELLKTATDLLVDMEHVSDEQESLSAGILRMWKQFYDDIWVWGVTPRIARLFEKLACAYDLQLASVGDAD